MDWKTSLDHFFLKGRQTLPTQRKRHKPEGKSNDGHDNHKKEFYRDRRDLTTKLDLPPQLIPGIFAEKKWKASRPPFGIPTFRENFSPRFFKTPWIIANKNSPTVTQLQRIKNFPACVPIATALRKKNSRKKSEPFVRAIFLRLQNNARSRTL